MHERSKLQPASHRRNLVFPPRLRRDACSPIYLLRSDVLIEAPSVPNFDAESFSFRWPIWGSREIDFPCVGNLAVIALCWAREHCIPSSNFSPSSHYGTCILAPPPPPLLLCSARTRSAKHDTGPSFVIPHHLHIRLARIPTHGPYRCISDFLTCVGSSRLKREGG